MPISPTTPPSGAGKTPEELKREAAFRELVAEMATKITEAQNLKQETTDAIMAAAAGVRAAAAESKELFIEPFIKRLEKLFDQQLFTHGDQIQKLWTARADLVKEINQHNKQLNRRYWITVGIFAGVILGVIGVGYWQTNQKAVYDKWWEQRYIERPDLKPKPPQQ
jgi:hypothetical protein